MLAWLGRHRMPHVSVEDYDPINAAMAVLRQNGRATSPAGRPAGARNGHLGTTTTTD
jgi:hypothetical protein